jgi:hypothetical protein
MARDLLKDDSALDEKVAKSLDLKNKVQEAMEGLDLTAWEEQFLSDLEEKLEKGIILTDYQEEKLEEILEERRY